MSAPSKRSRSMMNALDQTIPSAGHSRTGRSSRVAGVAWRNHAWSTIVIPFPELQMRSTTAPAANTLPSQWGIGGLDPVAGAFQDAEGRVPILPAEEDVEVLRVPCDARVALQGVRPPIRKGPCPALRLSIVSW